MKLFETVAPPSKRQEKNGKADHSMDRWPDVTPQIALASKGKVTYHNKTNSSIKPNKFHSTYVCFGGRKTCEERKIWLKIHLFGFPEMLVSRSAPTAARKVVSSLTLIGPFESKSRADNTTLHRRETYILSRIKCHTRQNSHTILYIHKLSHTPRILSLGRLCSNEQTSP